MWAFYIVAAMLTAGVVIKLTLTLAGKGRHAHGGEVHRSSRSVALFISAAIPIAALAIYLPLGRPDLPSTSALFFNPTDMLIRQQALLRRRPLQVLLEQNPEDLQSLVQLGEISSRLGDDRAAVEFFRRAVDVAKKTDDIFLRRYAVNLGEMQVKLAGGRVGPDAIETFEFVLTLYPESPFARYYLGLAKAQNGKREEAIEAWEKLLSEGSPRPYWKDMVRDSLSRVRAELKQENNNP